jgi:FAD/FMN-containing dehydrogenase
VLEPYGLHVPTGECEDVHVAGFMQGGGYGFTSRKFGIQTDQVLEVRVMLWDGRIVRASATRNHDLWWAVRGGTGGNFGVLLTIKYKLHQLGPVWGWAIAWPLATAADRAQAADAMRVLQRDFMRTGVPDAMTAQVQICNQSDWADHSDRAPWLLIRGLYLGPADEGERLIQPLLATAGARLQFTRTGSFRELNAYLLGQPHEIPQLPPERGMPKEDKQARFVARDLAPAEWRDCFDFFVTSPNPWSYMCLELYGGAINAYPIEDSAFIHRDVAFSAFLDVFWYDEEDKPAAEQFLTDWCTLMDRFSNGHIYQNYPSPDVPDYRENYFGRAFPALLAVKRKYDPHDWFTFEQAIKPRPGAHEIPAWPPRVLAALADPIA